MLSLNDFLSANYLPPYGTNLTPDDFRFRALTNKTEHPPGIAEWIADDSEVYVWETEAFGKDHQKHSYGIALVSNEFGEGLIFAILDGAVVPIENPYTSHILDVGSEIDVAEVYDWILRQDVQNHPDYNRSEWDGDDIESVMRRAAAGVYFRSENEANLENFSSLADFQKWLTDHLSEITLKVKAFEIDRKVSANWGYSNKIFSECHCGGVPCRIELLRKPTIAALNQTIPMLERHYHPDVSVSQIITPASVQLDETAHSEEKEDWARINRPVLRIRTDGKEIVGYCVMASVSLAQINQAVPLVTPENARPCTDDQNIWWGINLVGTDLTIVFPRRENIVLIQLDRDGADFEIQVLPVGERAALNLVTDRWHREWGKWLDSNIELSPAELRAGTLKAERMLTS